MAIPFGSFASDGIPHDLQVGIAGHAFDHLGGIPEQADAALASGANILYVSGLGALGYDGLPAAAELSRQRLAASEYLSRAKRGGIRLAIGYVCATSMVKLDSFDRNWPDELRRRFHSRPAEWRQQDRNGKPLNSWYGGDYEAACMNNPDWREYEKQMVRLQLEAGCDGIFFDNPTVHPEGCYCGYCLTAFKEFLGRAEGAAHDSDPLRPRRREGAERNAGLGPLPSPSREVPESSSAKALRAYAIENPKLFLRFRCTIARDFLAAMRSYARSIKPQSLITANNSLNSADVLFSQCRRYGYNIYEMSKAEDLVVVEDMSSQPRVLPGGATVEYSPTYKQLSAISHGKPIVAVTIADSDYHTPPNLVRLAMAEAAANGASYLSWPTWPPEQRERMAAAIRPEADFLRRNANLFQNARPRADVLLFLPFRKWLETDECFASIMAKRLTEANAQYAVICEDQLNTPGGQLSNAKSGRRGRLLPSVLKASKVLLVESLQDFNANERAILEDFSRAGGSIITARTGRDTTLAATDSPPRAGELKKDWLHEVMNAVREPSILVKGSPTVRALVSNEPKRTIVHLLNLNLKKLSSFTDELTPARDIQITVSVPRGGVRSVTVLTADKEGTSGRLAFELRKQDGQNLVTAKIPRLDAAVLLVIE